jgi:hypothetical protein
VLVAAGGVIGWLTVRNEVRPAPVADVGPAVPAAAAAPGAEVPEEAATADLTPAQVGRRAAAALAAAGRSPALHLDLHPAARFHCGLEGPAFYSTPIPPVRPSDDDATAA